MNGGKTLPEDTCYRLESTVSVTDGTLTIKPGVTVFASQGEWLVVQGGGRLVAQGTGKKPINFRGLKSELGFWSGIRIGDTGSGEHRLAYVNISHGGSTYYSHTEERGGLVILHNAIVHVENSTFAENRGAGAVVRDEQAVLTLKTSHFERNEWPIFATGNHLGGLGAGLTFSNNDSNGILVDKFRHPMEVTRDAVWRSHDVPYRIGSLINVDASVKIEPGAHFTFQHESGIYVRQAGSLVATGTKGSPIRFEGNERSASSWYGIRVLSKKAANHVAFAEIRHGGEGWWDSSGTWAASLTAAGDALLKVNDVLISDSTSNGVETLDNAKLIGCSNISFQNISELDFAGTILSAADCD